MKLRTTVWGLVAGIGTALSVIVPQIGAIFDSNPATNPDWHIVVGAVMTFAALIGLGKTAADDADVNPKPS